MITASIIVTAFAAGFVQAVTGFGCGIIMMAVLPFLFAGVTEAAVVSDLCAAALLYALAWKYKDSIRWKKILVPVLFYFIFSAVTIRMAVYMGDLKILGRLLGLLLLVFAGIMAFFSDRIHMTGSIPAAVICGTISGIMGGLFAMGGPGMAFYNLSVSETKEEYLGNNCLFLSLAATENNVLRIAGGLAEREMLPWFIGGTVAMLLGKLLGDKVVRNMPVEILKRSVYGLMGVSGLLSLIKG